MKPCVKN